MMKISVVFKLGKSQPELDFVDINSSKDIPLFIDPYFLARRNDRWSIEAIRTVKSFFQFIITLLKNSEIGRAKALFEHLSEPNETCLGLSQGRPEGRGVGKTDASHIFDKLLKSKAVKSGIVGDIEDCNIFVPHFGKDKLSDMTTNIIRSQLISYTQNQCRLCGMTLTQNVPSGFFWDRTKRCWDNKHTEMLVIKSQRILLVPKGIVSFCDDYTPTKYYQHFVLNFLQNEHLRLNTALVRERRRKGKVVKRYVTKKSLREKVAPFSKDFIRRFTEDHPEVFNDFKSRALRVSESISDREISACRGDLGVYNLNQVVDHLLVKLSNISAGKEGATEYHKTIVGLLELIFYPNLICPQIEYPIHQGRKRIDITFDNAAHSGFFWDLHTIKKIPSPYIYVECKNYSGDPKNPELDQLSGRFSPNRGKFGLLVCRKISDMEGFLQRCIDTHKDDRGVIIPIVDADLIGVLSDIKVGKLRSEETILTKRLRAVAMS